jgi:hypothetical protein
MQCWECKKQINEAKRVHYYSEIQEKEAGRDVCPECYSKLKFNPCHYVEVEKITQRSLK